MKFSVERDALLASLRHAHQIVSRADVIPILTTAAVFADLAGITIRAANYDMIAQTQCAADIDRVGDCAIALEPLVKLLQKLPSGTALTFDLPEPGAPMTLGYRRSRASIPTLTTAEFPSYDIGAGAFDVAIAGKDLMTLLATPLFVAEPDNPAPFSRGVHLHAEDDLIVAVAGVAGRLVRVDVPAPRSLSGMPGIIVPAKSCAEIIKLAEAAGPSLVSLAISERMLSAEHGGTRITTKLVDATYPDYRRIVPGRSEDGAILVCEEFSGALHRALVLADDRERIVRCAIADGAMTITARSARGGEITESIEVEGGDGISFGVNGKSAAEVLSAIGGDTVCLSAEGPGKPIVLRRPREDGIVCLVMPTLG